MIPDIFSCARICYKESLPESQERDETTLASMIATNLSCISISGAINPNRVTPGKSEGQGEPPPRKKKQKKQKGNNTGVKNSNV